MLNTLLQIIKRSIRPFNSSKYWEKRYQKGGNSGSGSYFLIEKFKTDTINEFLSNHKINSAIDFGCGDGNQIKNINYKEYLGLDVSKSAIALCNKLYKDKKNYTFKVLHDYNNEKADLSLSLDVIYHLIEDEVYISYMDMLFSSSKVYVVIYSSNTNKNLANRGQHYFNRKFSDLIEKKYNTFKLYQFIENKDKTLSGADFYIYKNTIK